MNKDYDYRYERKFFISDIDLHEVNAIVKLHPSIFSEIFHTRMVNNIYYDTFQFDNYFDNIDGNLKRAKPRIRWYGEVFDGVDKPVLEFKIKNGLQGTKLRYKLPTFKLDNRFKMKEIHHIIESTTVPESLKMRLKSQHPTLLNRYSRKYFVSADKRYRITIDTDQIFYKIHSRSNTFMNKVKDKVNIILELKYNLDADDDAKLITKHFPFRLTKSSKYVTGIERLFIQ